jgi:hypothetical protein
MEWWNFLTTGMSREQVKGAIMFSWRAIVFMQALWLWGFLAPIGLPQPFARVTIVAALQTDVKAIVDGLNTDRIDRITTDIFVARRQQCEALKIGTEEQKRQYSDRLNDLVSKYKRLTDMYPRVPGCDEV